MTKQIEVVARLFGRRFSILSITTEIKEPDMEKEKLVKIRITDAYGIGYVAGKEYMVTPAEALKLCQSDQAVALEELPAYKAENAIEKKPKIEKR
jgi:hypothetical protein